MTVIEALKSYSFSFSNEAELQAGIARVLDLYDIQFVREAAMTGGGRIDFLCGAIGIEIKVDGGATEVTRQLLRYAQESRIESLILVTSLARHMVMPRTLGGKPLVCLRVGGLA